MTRRYQLPFVAACLAIALTGCNTCERAQPVAMAPQAYARGTTSPDLQSPGGSGCSGAVARYHGVMANDHANGHVDQSVYDQIQREIAEAASACSAGQDARAVSLIQASKARHGYSG
jgi:hypothetical protein